MNNNQSAVLANFRLASVLPEPEVETGVPAECDPCSVRWLAPELLFPEEFGLEIARRTKETDIYAFAMVMYEVSPPFRLSDPPIGPSPHTFEYVTHFPRQVLCGLFPFQDVRNETVILKVRSGDHPCRPEGDSDLGLTDELWDAMMACWERRDRRWEVSRIVSTLEYHSTTAAALE